MYNPYNWKIHSKETACQDICVLHELGFICNELELCNIKTKRLQEELIENEKEKEKLIEKKHELIEKIRDQP